MLVSGVKRLTLQENPNLRGIYEISTSGSSGADGRDGRCFDGWRQRENFAAENLLNQIKERGTLRVGLEGTYPPLASGR
jgi:ABC-type amino acid transport substrate-binding protein